jgi:hypothetical protein
VTPEHELYLSNRAKEVLENEAYQLAHEDIRKEILSQWENAPFRDSEGRESLWVMLKQLDKLKLTLEATMQAGKLADANLRHKEKSLLQKAKEHLR